MSEKWIYKIDDLKMDNEALLVNETIFHNANGYIGVRSNFEEGYPEGYDTIRGSYINGFYDIAEMKQAEKLYGMAEEKETMLNVADGQTICVYLDGEKFSMERFFQAAAGWICRMVIRYVRFCGKHRMEKKWILKFAEWLLFPIFRCL